MKHAVVWLLLLAGCAVGPDYHPPQTKAPGNWSEAQSGGATNAPVQFTDWWKTFNDPELDSLIERAVKANYDLRIAEAQLLQARALRSGVAWELRRRSTVRLRSGTGNCRRMRRASSGRDRNSRRTSTTRASTRVGRSIYSVA